MEYKRKGDFQLVFPSNHSSLCIYKNLFEDQGNFGESMNTVLYKRFIDKGIFLRSK